MKNKLFLGKRREHINRWLLLFINFNLLIGLSIPPIFAADDYTITQEVTQNTHIYGQFSKIEKIEILAKPDKIASYAVIGGPVESAEECITSDEICDGKDNNCNGLVDENCPCIADGSCPTGNICQNGACCAKNYGLTTINNVYGNTLEYSPGLWGIRPQNSYVAAYATRTIYLIPYSISSTTSVDLYNANQTTGESLGQPGLSGLNYLDNTAVIFFDDFESAKAYINNGVLCIGSYKGEPPIINRPKIKPNEIIVKFKTDVGVRKNGFFNTVFLGQPRIATNAQSLNNLNKMFNVREQKQLFSQVKKRTRNVENNYILELETDENISNVLENYKSDPNVEYASLNHFYSTSTIPDDPYYSTQWAHQNINSEPAWDIEKGDGTVISVIDTGVEYSNQDLAGNMLADCNGGCPQGTGYNFVNVNMSIFDDPSLDPLPGENYYPSNNPLDVHGHGTHVSGIIAAVSNNSMGVAGTCWNCKIMPLKALFGYMSNETGTWQAYAGGYTSDIAEAVYYAIDNNVSVISMSFGSYVNETEDPTLYNATLAAANSGIILVAAAGNDNTSQKLYPAAWPHVIAVAATTSSDNKASFSNYGSWVDVSAPGYNISSTYIGDSYAYMSGTSMAAPFVSGLAGLILSRNPSLAKAEVDSLIIDNARNIDANNPSYVGMLGSGLINLFQSVELTPDTDWPMFKQNPTHSGYISSAAPDTNNLLWKTFINTTKVSNAAASSPTLADGIIYAGRALTDNATVGLVAVNATTGQVIWNYNITGIGASVVSTPAVGYGRVFFGSGNFNVYALNKTNGNLLWRYNTTGLVLGSPTFFDQKVYIASFTGNLYALNATTSNPNGELIWSTNVGNVPHSTPAINEGVVCIGSGSAGAVPANISCLNAFTGSILWKYGAGGGIYSSPAIKNGIVYFNSDDKQVYALNFTNGQRIWNYTIGPNGASPSVAFGRAFTMNDMSISGNNFGDRFLYSFNSTTGNLLWKYNITRISPIDGQSNAPKSSPSVSSDGKVCFGIDGKGPFWPAGAYKNGSVACLNALTNNPNGELIWEYQFGEGVTVDSSPAIANNKLYMVASDGYLYAFGDSVASDTTPPSSVTNLQSSAITNSSIIWSWINPSDADFDKTILYLNSVNVVNLSKPIASYTANGLLNNTLYNLTIHTADNSGNVNATNIQNLTWTLQNSNPTPPAAITNFTVDVTNATSSTISLSWNPVSGAASYNVYITPEPETLGNYSMMKLMGNNSGNTNTTFVINNVAAAVDTFIRVEAINDSGVFAAGDAHAKTVGGQAVTLDNELREVHMVAPNIMELVLENKGIRFYYDPAAGFTTGSVYFDNGPIWQNGNWQIRKKDGSIISVNNIYRNSYAVNMPYYFLNGQSEDNFFYDIDHRVFLVLDNNLSQKEILSIEGPFNLNFTLLFSDNYLETDVIQVNQVGYHPDATKRFAYVSMWMGDGRGMDFTDYPSYAEVLKEPNQTLTSRSIVLSNITLEKRYVADSCNASGIFNGTCYTGWYDNQNGSGSIYYNCTTIAKSNTVPLLDYDCDTDAKVRDINLSALQPNDNSFRYRVKIPGVGVSYPTMVSKEAFFKAYYTIARGIYYNRWCGNYSTEFTEWSRPPDHCFAYVSDVPVRWAAQFPSTTPIFETMPVVGGHRDAGDYDLRPHHTGIPQMIMKGYETNKNSLINTDNQLNIPESGNGIPDILDEALWNLKSWESFQMGTDGLGDACDLCPDDPENDADGDKVCAGTRFNSSMIAGGDNCPRKYNPLQEDLDGDTIGDACDSSTIIDRDSDGITDNADNCIGSSLKTDTDSDWVGDACDTCPNDPENDIDGDLICYGSGFSPPMTNDSDNCPHKYNPDQADSDGDGIADSYDCAPDDGDFYQLLSGYKDNDQDTYTVGNEEPVCSAENLPDDYRSQQSSVDDCDDNNGCWTQTYENRHIDASLVRKASIPRFENASVVAGF